MCIVLKTQKCFKKVTFISKYRKEGYSDFLVAAVTNDHKLSGLKQNKYCLKVNTVLEVSNLPLSIRELKSRLSIGLVSF